MVTRFETFTLQHFMALLVFAVFTIAIIWMGQNSDDKTKFRIGFSIALLALSVSIIDSIYRLLTHHFDVLTDLPLFLCDLVGYGLIWVILTKNRKWLGILYFWAVAGTMQALITPELEAGFPTFEYFRYFIAHAGIVSAVIYCIVVWKIGISWRDFFNAILYAQIYLVVIHMINLILGSNYGYTISKPRDPSILDLMGEWPWYLLLGELVMIVLFIMLMIPFLWRHKNGMEQVSIPGSPGSDH